MKTILFIDKGEKDLWSFFLKYDFLLDEFRSSGAFAVCEWNRGGMSVAEAIPGLLGALGDESDWQAVIVSDLRLPMDELRKDLHFDNPFDFQDRYDVRPGEPFCESQHAIVRLSQMLGGLPEKTYIEWASDAGDERLITGHSLLYAEGGDDYAIIDRYRLGLPRPRRVVCVSPRDVDDAFYGARYREIEAMGNRPSLDFWQRNDYPDNARFVVFDFPAPALSPDFTEDAFHWTDSEASGRRSEWFEFWMGVLYLMVVNYEPSELKAFMVNTIKVEVDERALTNMLAYRRAEWVSARRTIAERSDRDSARLVASEYKMAQIPATSVVIPLSFDQTNADRLYSDPSEVKLMKDDPTPDNVVWRRQKARISDEFRELLRAPRRALRNAAARFRAAGPVPEQELEYCVLNEYQKDKLEDEIREREFSLARDVGRAPFEFESHQDEFDAKSEEIEGEIAKRAVRSQALLILAMTLAAVVVGLFPYCCGLLVGADFSRSSVALTAVCAVVLALVWFATLLSMKKSVQDKYRAFNETMKKVLLELTTEAKRLELKISSYATFRKEWSVLDRQSHLDLPTREANRLGYKSALLKTRIRDIDEISRNCEVDSAAYVGDIEFDWETLSRLLDDDSFYNVRGSHKATACGRMQDGLELSLPYSFITRVSLDALRLK